MNARPESAALEPLLEQLGTQISAGLAANRPAAASTKEDLRV